LRKRSPGREIGFPWNGRMVRDDCGATRRLRRGRCGVCATCGWELG